MEDELPNKRSRRATRYSGDFQVHFKDDSEEDDEPVADRKNYSKKARTKECPGCGCDCPVSIKVCNSCDYLFTSKSMLLANSNQTAIDEAKTIRDRFLFEPEREEDGTLIVQAILGRRPKKSGKRWLRPTALAGVALADMTATEAKFEYEYLVKYKSLSYLHVQWLGASEIDTLNSKSRQMLQRYLSRIDKGDGSADEDGDIDPTWLEIEKILDVREEEVTEVVDHDDEKLGILSSPDKQQNKSKLSSMVSSNNVVATTTSNNTNNNNNNNSSNNNNDAVENKGDDVSGSQMEEVKVEENTSMFRRWNAAGRCRKVLEHIMEDGSSLSFRDPVDTTLYDDYLDVVAEPMCLTDVMQKLDAGEYSKQRQVSRFAADMRLIWQNCKTYNLYKSQIWYTAHAFSLTFERLYQSWVLSFADGSLKFDDPLGQPWGNGCRICLQDENDESILLCDHCDASYHIYCLQPPLKKIPEDAWLCQHCTQWLEKSGARLLSAGTEDEVRMLAESANQRKAIRVKKKKYLVKWMGLSYRDCTWETAKDIKDDDKIADFHKLNDSPPEDPPLTQSEISIELSKDRRTQLIPAKERPSITRDLDANIYAQIRSVHFLRFDKIPTPALLRESGPSTLAYTMGHQPAITMPTSSALSVFSSAVHEEDKQNEELEAATKKQKFVRVHASKSTQSTEEKVAVDIVREEVSLVLSDILFCVARGALPTISASAPAPPLTTTLVTEEEKEVQLCRLCTPSMVFGGEVEVCVRKGAQPLCMKLGVDTHGNFVVSGFVAADSNNSKGPVERTGRVFRGDILVAVNGVDVTNYSSKHNSVRVKSKKTETTVQEVKALLSVDSPFVYLRLFRLPVSVYQHNKHKFNLSASANSNAATMLNVPTVGPLAVSTYNPLGLYLSHCRHRDIFHAPTPSSLYLGVHPVHSNHYNQQVQEQQQQQPYQWRAEFFNTSNGRMELLGVFDDEVQAARVRDVHAKAFLETIEAAATEDKEVEPKDESAMDDGTDSEALAEKEEEKEKKREPLVILNFNEDGSLTVTAQIRHDAILKLRQQQQALQPRTVPLLPQFLQSVAAKANESKEEKDENEEEEGDDDDDEFDLYSHDSLDTDSDVESYQSNNDNENVQNATAIIEKAIINPQQKLKELAKQEQIQRKQQRKRARGEDMSDSEDDIDDDESSFNEDDDDDSSNDSDDDGVENAFHSKGKRNDVEWKPENSPLVFGEGDVSRLFKAVMQSDFPPIRQEWENHVIELGFPQQQQQLALSSSSSSAVKTRLIQKIDQLDMLSGVVIETWDSVKAAARQLGIRHELISKALNGTDLEGMAGGFKWKYTVFEIKDTTNSNGEEEEEDEEKAGEQQPKTDSWKSKLYLESKEYRSGGTLRDYQLDGLNWLLRCWYSKRSSILADEMGLGKTVQVVTFLDHLFEAENIRGPFLVTVPLSTIAHWKREMEGWSNMITCVYHDVGGGRDMRDVIREYEWYYKGRSRRLLKFHVLITTYDDLIRDYEELAEIPWRVVVVDEAHRLRNSTSKLLDCMRSVVAKGLHTYGYQHRILMTGTPLQNNTAELFTLLNFIEPAKFPDAEKFAERYGHIQTQQQVESLQKRIAPHLIRRVKEDVAKDIPPKEETIIDVELTTMQKQYYRAIFEHNHSFLLQSLGKNIKSANMPKLMNIQMELRKCCNHPFLIAGIEQTEMETLEKKLLTDMEQQRQKKFDQQLFERRRMEEILIPTSGKMVLIDKLLPKLRKEKHKVLIFSQMVKMLDVLEEYCHFRHYPVERLDGSVRGNERQLSIDRFNGRKAGNNSNSSSDNKGGDVDGGKDDAFVFLLSTRAGGVGINLTAADTVIIFDSDWNPQNDVQAMARCHRIGQQKQVTVYRLITRRSFEAEMFGRASKKLGLEQALLSSSSLFNSNNNDDDDDGDGGEDGDGEPKAGGGSGSGGDMMATISNMNKSMEKMSAAELELLLREGAYAFLDDNDDDNNNSRQFFTQDIDQILEQRTHVHVDATSGNNGGGTESWLNKSKKPRARKSLFTGDQAMEHAEIDVNDPDFWKKVLPDLVTPDTMLLRLNDHQLFLKTPNNSSNNNNSNSSSSSLSLAAFTGKLRINREVVKKFMKDMAMMMAGMDDLLHRQQLPEQQRSVCIQLLHKIVINHNFINIVKKQQKQLAAATAATATATAATSGDATTTSTATTTTTTMSPSRKNGNKNSQVSNSTDDKDEEEEEDDDDDDSDSDDSSGGNEEEYLFSLEDVELAREWLSVVEGTRRRIRVSVQPQQQQQQQSGSKRKQVSAGKGRSKKSIVFHDDDIENEDDEAPFRSSSSSSNSAKKSGGFSFDSQPLVSKSKKRRSVAMYKDDFDENGDDDDDDDEEDDDDDDAASVESYVKPKRGRPFSKNKPPGTTTTTTTTPKSSSKKPVSSKAKGKGKPKNSQSSNDDDYDDNNEGGSGVAVVGGRAASRGGDDADAGVVTSKSGRAIKPVSVHSPDNNNNSSNRQGKSKSKRAEMLSVVDVRQQLLQGAGHQIDMEDDDNNNMDTYNNNDNNNNTVDALQSYDL